MMFFYPGPEISPVQIPGPVWPVNVVFGILQVLASLLGLGQGTTKLFETGINNTWANFMLTSGFMYNALGLFRNFVLKLLGIVADGLKHIISDVLHGHLLQALKDIQKLLNDLHALFAPLIEWLRKLQKLQRQLQLQAMRNVINLIQRARKVLVLFKLLHVKWAQKLDNILAGVEGKIISREFEIVRKTNELIGWIDLITNPLGALRHAAVLGPLGVWLSAIAGTARALDLDKAFPALFPHPGGTTPGTTWPPYAADTAAQAAAGLGHYANFSASSSATLARITSELGA